MIGLWAGSGGSISRLVGEIVPLGVALVAGQMAWPFLGVVGGIAVFLFVWVATSALLVRVRRRPRLRRAYRAAVLLHVAFWTVRGLIVSSAFVAPGAPVAGPVVDWGRARAFRAGVGTATFDLPERTTLAGWGQRPRRVRLPAFGGLGVLGRLSLRVMGAPAEGEAPRAPLFTRPAEPGGGLGARALLLTPDGDGPSFAVVRLDLIALDAGLADDVLAAVGDELGLTPATLLVAATHTHSCPGGAQRTPLAVVAGADHFDGAVHDAVLAAAVEALRTAAADRRPSRIAFPRTRDRDEAGVPILTRNRCLESDEIDDRVLALRIEDAATGRTRALLLHYALQPVKVRRHALHFDRDLPGALEDTLSAALPDAPTVLFVNGALGDVSPRQGTAEELAERFTARVRDDLLAGPAFDRIRLRAADARRDLGTPRTFVAVGSRALFHDRVLPPVWDGDAPTILAHVVALPANMAIWSLGLSEVRLGFTFDGAAGAVVNLEPLVGSADARAGAVVLEGEADGRRADRAVLLWQGGSPTQHTGRRWRDRATARGLGAPFVLSLTNGSLGYLATAEEYDGICTYEGRATLFGRDSARLVAETLDAALAAALGD